MSILLEALKKSERQRQLGQTPTLETASGGQTPSTVSMNHWIPISLVALSAMAMGWFGWQQFREPDTGIDSGATEELVQAGEQAKPRTMTEQYQPGAEEPEGQISPGVLAAKNRGKDREKLNRSFSEYKTESLETNSETPNREPEEIVEGDRRQVADHPPNQVAETPAHPPVRPEVNRARPEPGATESGRSKVEPHIAEPISYWELPQGVRDNLPEIKITVLVYAENPGDRFVLTNGQRLIEKDELQSGIVLDEIRRDGAVFLYRNYRFLIKG